MPAVVRSCLLVLSLLALLAGCTARREGIADLERFPQDAARYLPTATADEPLIPPEEQAHLDAEYNKRFFAPWHRQRAHVPAAAAFWALDDLGRKQGYAENLLPLGGARWEELTAALRRESYPSLARPAITVRNTACRAFPTARPFFLDPRKAGEGYPFDYLQSSALWTGTPVLVTHESLDGAWLFVETGFVYGWVPAQDVAWADKAFRAAYQTGRYAALLYDEVTLRDKGGEFLAQTHLGGVFPVAGESGHDIQILVPVRGADGVAHARTARVSTELAAIKPLPLQPARIAELANRMLGQPYGWGGLYENRDCSATLRDLFTPFGVWLPRNSAEQARSGGSFQDLAPLSRTEKRERILRQGVPFYTLIWLKGHIGLYLGTDPASGEPLLLHNLWGVRTRGWDGREGRALVARLAITSLHPGEERPDVRDGQFYDRILGLTVLPGLSLPPVAPP
jgi:cell wall-associated NlpC family hydrolase